MEVVVRVATASMRGTEAAAVDMGAVEVIRAVPLEALVL